MARIDPIPMSQFPKQMWKALAGLNPPDARYTQPSPEGRPAAANIIGILAHHPELATAYCTLNGYLLMKTTLTEVHRELVILRLSAVRRSSYEWAQHLFMAHDAGLTDDVIGAVAFGPDSPIWAGPESALLRAVDELAIDDCIGADTWSKLTEHYDIQQILDIIFTVGSYDIMARMNKSLELEIDLDIKEFLKWPRTLPVGTDTP